MSPTTTKWTYMLITLVFFVSVKILSLKLSKSLDNAIEWFLDNKLTLQSKKPELLSFGKEHDSDLLTTNGFESKQHCKSLGVHIDKKWSLLNIYGKLIKAGRVLWFYLQKRHFSWKPLIILYNSLANFVVTYDVLVYECTFKSFFEIIMTLQHKIVRAIFFLHHTDVVSTYPANTKLTLFLICNSRNFSWSFQQYKKWSFWSEIRQ